MDSHDSATGGRCPGPDALAAFRRRDLPPDALVAMADHVAGCTHCLSALAGLVERQGGSSHDSGRPRPESPADGPAPGWDDAWASRLLTAEHGGRPAPHPVSPAPPAPPFTLGQYRVMEKIGQGGMGAVYRALHVRLKKAVAVKILPPDRMGEPQAVARFEREMEAVGRLNHNNIVRATDAGEANGVHFLVMELIDGIDLARLVRLHGPLPVAAACELVRQAAVGLQYVHEHDLVHRDVKPSNLLLSSAGELKILDLGLALLGRGGPASGELTVDGQPMGTADYMAPEQWDDSHAVDIRADIYSLGCTLYTLLMGGPPFAGPKHGSMVRKMAAHVREHVRKVTEQRGDVPAAVDELLARMMAKEPADRPSTPAEVAQALAPFCGEAQLAALAVDALARLRSGVQASPQQANREAASPVAPTPPGGRTVTRGRAARPRRRYLWAGAAVLIACVTLVTIAAVAYLRLWPTPAPPPPPVGVWQRLLAKPPERRLWVAQAGAHLDPDPQAETLLIDSSAPALLRLGETNARAYKLEVAFRQRVWTGGFGVYIGGRPAAPPDTFRFQRIDLRAAWPPTNPPAFRLWRSADVVRADARGLPEIGGSGFASAPLKDTLDFSEQMLQLEVKPNGLYRVKWQGTPYRELVEGEAAAKAGPLQAEHRGEFGVYAEGSSVTVTTAQFMVIEY